MPEDTTAAPADAATATASVVVAQPELTPEAAPGATPEAAPEATEGAASPSPVSDAAPDAPEKESLVAFCLRASRTDRRVELLGAFYHAMRAANSMSDTVENWHSALAKFARQPA